MIVFTKHKQYTAAHGKNTITHTHTYIYTYTTIKYGGMTADSEKNREETKVSLEYL